MASPDFSIPGFGTVAEIILELITNPEFKHGLARCSAVRKMIYTDTYVREGFRMYAGFCQDECSENDFWDKSETVILLG